MIGVEAILAKTESRGAQQKLFLREPPAEAAWPRPVAAPSEAPTGGQVAARRLFGAGLGALLDELNMELGA